MQKFDKECLAWYEDGQHVYEIKDDDHPGDYRPSLVTFDAYNSRRVRDWLEDYAWKESPETPEDGPELLDCGQHLHLGHYQLHEV